MFNRKKIILSALCVILPHLNGLTEEPLPPIAAIKKEKGTPSSFELYLKVMNEHGQTLGPLGCWQNGEIEIVLNPELVKKIEKQTKSRLISKGIPAESAEKWSSVGIIAEDNYWIWVRDAVIFPSGVYGTYDRLSWKSGLSGGVPGVAILPVLSNKKIVLNINYRHATRSWEAELPRGQKEPGETLEKTALRELQEETGYQACKALLIGEMTTDSGVLASIIPVFYAEVIHSGESAKEFSEAISENPAFSKQELKTAFANGYMNVAIKGKIVKVHCRDPYLAFALFQAENKGLL